MTTSSDPTETAVIGGDSLLSKVIAETIAEAFRAGVLAGFMSSHENWNGEWCPGDDELNTHLDEVFAEYFPAYIAEADR